MATIFKRKGISKALRFQVFSRDGFACRYCGSSRHEGAELHVDHVKPVSAGGSNEIANLVTACQPCNIGKGAINLTEPVPFKLVTPEKGEPAFGLRFGSDGRLRDVFHIDSIGPVGATVTLYSFLTCEPHSKTAWLIEDIRASCLLFSDKDEWLRAASHWDGDIEADRVNPKFAVNSERVLP
jgi:hypothetical protein